MIAVGFLAAPSGARADERVAALAPGPSGDVVAVYVDVSAARGEDHEQYNDASGHFEILDLGAEVAIAHIDNTALRLFGDLPILSGATYEPDDTSKGHGLGNPSVGVALTGHGLGGDLRVGFAVTPLLSQDPGERGGVEYQAGLVGISHGLAPWLGSEYVGSGAAVRAAARLTIARDRGFVAIEPAFERVFATETETAAELAVAAGLRWDNVTLFAEGAVARGSQTSRDLMAPSNNVWSSSLALAVRVARDGGWAVTPWIAAPVTGQADQWIWLSIGCSLDVAR